MRATEGREAMWMPMADTARRVKKIWFPTAAGPGKVRMKPDGGACVEMPSSSIEMWGLSLNPHVMRRGERVDPACVIAPG